MKVLLVDDEEDLVATLAERLSFRGIDARWATNGFDAVAITEREPFDVVVLDVKMPHLGGIELKKKLERIRPEMKFMFLTGHGSEEDYRIGSVEADRYLAKPLDIEDFVATLMEVVSS